MIYDSSLDFTTGINAGITGTVGVAYNGTTNDDLRPYNSMSFKYEKHNPTITGKGTLEGKVHIFPRIHAWICGVAGPSIDIKPYAKLIVGGSFKDVIGNSSEDYIASSLKTYVGVDLALGLSRSSWNYESWNKSTSDINIGEYQLYTSPYDLKFKDGNKRQDGAIDVSFEVYDKSIGDNTFLSPLCPIVKFEAEGTIDNRYAVAQQGIAKVKWKPLNDKSNLVAKIFDLDGKVIAQADYGNRSEDKGAGYAVDLGLPSGLKWASCNVGASSPEEYGDYFAWGETEPKETYNWRAYKWCNGSDDTMTKYCTSRGYGTVDNKTNLDPEDDAARVNWGGAWRMPTPAEQNELLIKSTWTRATQNGVKGYKVTGPNGSSIFLPAAGYRNNGGLHSAGSFGDYWSSSLDASSSDRAYDLDFYLGDCDWIGRARCYGMSVRPVCQ